MEVRAPLCVSHGSPAHRRLAGAEALVIVVVVVVAAMLTTGGMSINEMMSRLAAAGLLAVGLTQLATGAVATGLRRLAGTPSSMR
jgi:hypothetical protein